MRLVGPTLGRAALTGILIALLTCTMTGVAAGATNSSAPTIAALSLSRTSLPAIGGVVSISATVTDATSCLLVTPANAAVTIRVHLSASCRSGLLQGHVNFGPNYTPKTVRVRVRVLVRGVGHESARTLLITVHHAPGIAIAQPAAASTFAATPVTPTASLTTSTGVLSLSGGTVQLVVSATNASTCAIEVIDATANQGAAPQAVNCSGTYVVNVPASTTSNQWAFLFVSVSSTGAYAYSVQTLAQGTSVALAVIGPVVSDISLGSLLDDPLLAFGGTAPYTWTVSSGTLPPGLSLSASGELSGTPLADGTYSWSVAVSDSSTPAESTTQTFTVTVVPFGGDDTGENWSGYAVNSASVITDVSGEWTVPTLNCAATPNATMSPWVGLGGKDTEADTATTEPLLQTGTIDECTNGTQHDAAWWELFPSNPNESVDFEDFPVSPGDTIDASVLENSSGQWITVLENLTTGLEGIMIAGAHWGIAPISSTTTTLTEQGKSTNIAYQGGHTAEWIVEDPAGESGNILPFADYDTVTFSNLATSLEPWSLLDIDQLSIIQGQTLTSTPTLIDPGDFSVTYSG